MDKEIHKFNLTPLTQGTLTPTREVRTRANTFGVALWEDLRKVDELFNWNSFSTNDSADIWGALEEAGTANKSEMALDITSQPPVIEMYHAYTTVPARLWGHGDADYFTETRDSISELLVNRVRIQQLSQIVWGGVEGTIPQAQQCLKTIWDNPLTMQSTVTASATASLISCLDELIAEYMTGSGRYPKEMVLNPTAMGLLGTTGVGISEAIVGLDNLYDVHVSCIPDFTATSNAPKVVMGDFKQYYMFQPKEGGEHEVNLEGHDKNNGEEFVTFFNVGQNQTEVLFEDVTAGNVMTGQSFLSATINGLTAQFTVDVSAIDSTDTLG